MKTININLAIAAILLSLACSNPSDKSQNTIAKKTGKKNSLQHDTTLEQQNVFAANAAIGGIMEVESSARIIKSTENPDVQTLATIMLKDHSMANKELKALAQKLKLQLPTSLPKEKINTLTKMESLKEFEKNLYYADLMVAEHKQAVALFEKANQTEEGELRSFAANHLLTLKHHLMEAEHVQKILHSIKNDKGDFPLKISKSNQ